MKYALWLSNIPGIGRGKIHYLLDSFETAEEVYVRSEEQIRKVPGISEKDVQNIIKSKRNWNLEARWMELNEKGISFVSRQQKEFPEKLRLLADPPYSLYYIGRLPDPSESVVGMVGARNRSAYGCEITRALARSLTAHGVSVISGMARGIDTDSHLGAIRNGGTTFAVLGCGVDICYPEQNRYLYEEIPKKGGILSEYPIGTQPKPNLFPSRNRIIAGLSDCLLVTEARKKSGSLITADYAMEQGKDVYALPGRVTDPLSEGCNELIRQGAGVIGNPEFFYEEWKQLHHTECTQLDFRWEILDNPERAVYSLIEFVPVSIGGLLEQLDFPLDELIVILGKLEEKGYIKETIPNYYIRTI